MEKQIKSFNTSYINLAAGITFAHKLKQPSNLVFVRNPDLANIILFGDDAAVSATRYQVSANVDGAGVFVRSEEFDILYLLSAGAITRVTIEEYCVEEPVIFLIQAAQKVSQDVNVISSVLPAGAATQATLAAILALVPGLSTEVTSAAILAAMAGASTEVTSAAILAALPGLSTEVTSAAILAALGAGISITSLPGGTVYPAGATPFIASATSGANAAASATVAAVAGKQHYCVGWMVSLRTAAAANDTLITLNDGATVKQTDVIGNAAPVGTTKGVTSSTPILQGTANTAMSINAAAAGAGAITELSIWGYTI